MMPGARLAAAIDLLDQILHAARHGGPAADVLAARYFSQRRYAGAKDRAAVRELVYTCLRRLPAGAAEAGGRIAMLGHAMRDAPALLPLFGSGGYAPEPLTADEMAIAAAHVHAPLDPPWLEAGLRRRFGDGFEQERAGLAGRAPFMLRVNSARSTRHEAMARLGEEGIEAHLGLLSPWSLEVSAGARIETSKAYARGLVEIQDEASQIFCLLAGARAGQTVVDLCAGAGGKTLALGASMGGSGRLVACDVAEERLRRLPPRAGRAGITAVDYRLLDPSAPWETVSDLAAACDRVIVDAPCSGSGTWRRNPESRFRLSADSIAVHAGAQLGLIATGARLVKPGGRLAYGVCSLLPEEGEAVIEAALRSIPDLRLLPWSKAAGAPPLANAAASPDCLCLTPGRHGCDGFFIALFERLC